MLPAKPEAPQLLIIDRGGNKPLYQELFPKGFIENQ